MDGPPATQQLRQEKGQPMAHFIQCTASEAVAAFEADRAKWGDKQWCWAYPGNFPYFGMTNYYWCALQTTRNLLPGVDMRKHIKLWGYVPAWYEFMAQAPASQFLTINHSVARAGDIIIYQRGGSAAAYSYHIGMISAATRGDTMYTAEGDTSSSRFPGSESTGGVIAYRQRSASAARSGPYTFRIWRPDYVPEHVPAPIKAREQLKVDGIVGPATVRALEQHFKTPVDGVISSQPSTNKWCLPALTAVQWVAPSKATGSTVVKAWQRHVGAKSDGFLGPNSVKLTQRKVGVKADGVLGSITGRAIQSALNNGSF